MNDEWYRNTSSGDAGRLVERDGKKYIKLDRPNEPEGFSEYLFKPHEWKLDNERRPMTAHQVAEIKWVAMCKLEHFLGNHQRAKKNWLNLSDAQRIKFMNVPPKSAVRRRLWEKIGEAMLGLM
jgi:hypothetical protein